MLLLLQNVVEFLHGGRFGLPGNDIVEGFHELEGISLVGADAGFAPLSSVTSRSSGAGLLAGVAAGDHALRGKRVARRKINIAISSVSFFISGRPLNGLSFLSSGWPLHNGQCSDSWSGRAIRCQ